MGDTPKAKASPAGAPKDSLSGGHELQKVVGGDSKASVARTRGVPAAALANASGGGPPPSVCHPRSWPLQPPVETAVACRHSCAQLASATQPHIV